MQAPESKCSPGLLLCLGQTPPVACGDSPLKEGAFPGGKASGSGAKLPVSPEPPSLREVANPQGLTEGVCPAPRGFFVFGDNCQKELRNLGDMPVDMRGGGMAKINSDGESDLGSPKPSEFENRRNITMKMFKRFAAALLAGVMVLAMLTACGGGAGGRRVVPGDGTPAVLGRQTR